jgi:hypothetical protein
VSIKGGERNIREAHSAMEITIRISHTSFSKQWDKYNGHVKNKQNLCQFLCEEWCSLGQEMLQPGQEMVVAGGFADGTRAVLVSNGQHDAIGHLKSDHEEADTRLLLHAKYASNTHSRIVIHSSDTDVCVLCVVLYQESNFHKVWFRTGIRDKLRFIPCHSIASRIGDGVCKALPAYHAISGCDSTSALAGVGKKKCIKLLREDQGVQDILSLVGVPPRMTANMLQDTETCICQMYGAYLKTADETCYWMFCQECQKSESLPPTTDSLHLHIKRSNYQTYIWRKSLHPMQNLPDPTSHGWEMSDGALQPQLLTKPSAPTGLGELVMCNCRKSACKSNLCSCKVIDLVCTEGCVCMGGDGCQNPNGQMDDSSDEDN